MTDGSLWRSRDVRGLAIVSSLAFTSYCLLLAAAPAWAARGGASRAGSGLVTTAMLLTTVAAQGLVPATVRRIGSGPGLAAGLLLLGVPGPGYGLSSDLPSLLVLAAIRGLGFALITVIGAAMTGIVAPPGRHGETVGIYGLAIAIPNLVAIPLGVTLTLNGHFPVAAWASACAVLAVPVALRVGRTAGAAGPGVADPRPAARPPTRWVLAMTAAPSIALLTVTAAGGGFVTFLPIDRRHGWLASVGLLVFGACSALARWRAGVLADRIGTRLLLPISLLAAAIGLIGACACLAHGRSLDALLVVAAGVCGAGYGATQNLTLVIAFARAGATGAPVASAVWNACYDTGTAAGAAGVGALAGLGLGLPAAMAVGSALVLAALPLALSQRRMSRPA